jgi:hypothetical protein
MVLPKFVILVLVIKKETVRIEHVQNKKKDLEE